MVIADLQIWLTNSCGSLQVPSWTFVLHVCIPFKVRQLALKCALCAGTLTKAQGWPECTGSGMV